MEKIFDKKNVILVKLDETDLMSFLVDTDLQDNGDYDWRLEELADEIISVAPEYVFADYTGSSVSLTEMVDKLRESARCIYKVKEYDLMRRWCLDKDPDAHAEILSKGYKSRGEFGELLLHLLLRDFKSTIPLVSKVYFKDSASVPAHGFDAVHISPNEKILWLGESKLYATAKSGLKALMSDLDEHFRHDYLNEQFAIISKNLKNNTIPQRDHWISVLSNCSKLSEQLDIINIPLLCVYPDDIYEKFIDVGDSQAYEYHEKSVRELKQYFDDNMKHPLRKELNIILFMFPVKDKEQFVMKLHEKLWHMQNI